VRIDVHSSRRSPRQRRVGNHGKRRAPVRIQPESPGNAPCID
jgi:hypothetical protein